MLTARITEGVSPVTKAYAQSSNKARSLLNNLPRLPSSMPKSCSKKSIMPYTKPTCKPETDSTCIAPTCKVSEIYK